MSLGGKTPEEAHKDLEENTPEEIELTDPTEEESDLPTDKLGVNFDIQETVNQTYAVGQRGGILERLYERMKSTWSTLHVPLAAGYDREQLRNSLRGNLPNLFAALTVEPVEAGFEVNGGEVSVTKSHDGQEVDEEKLLDDVEAGLLEGKRKYEVPIAITQPNLTTEEAEKLKPTTLLGSYRTDYRLTSDKSPERVENLKITSNAITGKFLAPGEVFSFNELAAPFDYYPTKVIVGGKEDLADGGGLCQVSSTLYNAASYAGLEVVERATRTPPNYPTSGPAWTQRCGLVPWT